MGVREGSRRGATVGVIRKRTRPFGAASPPGGRLAHLRFPSVRHTPTAQTSRALGGPAERPNNTTAVLDGLRKGPVCLNIRSAGLPIIAAHSSSQATQQGRREDRALSAPGVRIRTHRSERSSLHRVACSRFLPCEGCANGTGEPHRLRQGFIRQCLIGVVDDRCRERCVRCIESLFGVARIVSCSWTLIPAMKTWRGEHFVSREADQDRW